MDWYGFPDLARDHIWRVPVPQCWNFFSRARARGQLIFIRKWVETGGKTARATLCGGGRKGTRSQPSSPRVLVYYSSKWWGAAPHHFMMSGTMPLVIGASNNKRCSLDFFLHKYWFFFITKKLFFLKNACLQIYRRLIENRACSQEKIHLGDSTSICWSTTGWRKFARSF